MYTFPLGPITGDSFLLGSITDSSPCSGPPVEQYESSSFWSHDSRVRRLPHSRLLLKSTKIPIHYLVVVRFHLINFHSQRDHHLLWMILEYRTMMMLMFGRQEQMMAMVGKF